MLDGPTETKRMAPFTQLKGSLGEESTKQAHLSALSMVPKVAGATLRCATHSADSRKYWNLWKIFEHIEETFEDASERIENYVIFSEA